jgi:hypothetical protein
MQVRWEGERNPNTLLVGIQTNEAIMEISMEFPQKMKGRPTIWSSYTTPDHTSEGM